jgi:dihydroorotate dehydrogenase electron transfer subunit
MGSPLHAAHYADHALERLVDITANQRVADQTLRVRIVCPEIAERVVPGQFLMVRIAGGDDPLIGRALAVYAVVPAAGGRPAAIDLIYHVKGKFTKRLAGTLPGQQLLVWGPLGNGFPPLACRHLIMVAGGVGQTPFLSLAREHLGRQRFGCPPRQVQPVPRVTLCFGAQSAGFLACVEDFQQLGIDVQLATDDGTIGYRGLVTDLLSRLLQEGTDAVTVVSCGPVAMMRRCAEITAARQVPCWVSLETPMACGIGICFSCVARVRDERGEVDYKRTCVEGPIFDATRIHW